MTEQLLDKLKIKPIPKVKENLEIKIKKQSANKEDIIIKTKIIDKTNEDIIDRNDFLLAITDKSDHRDDRDEISTKKDTTIKISEDKESSNIIKNQIKLNKRLILEQANIEEIEMITNSTTKIKIPSIKTTIITKTTPRITKSPIGIAIEGPTSQLIIGDTILINRLPPNENKILIRASNYYMNNREIFINFITSLFGPYKENIEKDNQILSCDSKNNSFNLLTHQKIVRDYINLYKFHCLFFICLYCFYFPVVIKLY
jgi:hypothetical protein